MAGLDIAMLGAAGAYQGYTRELDRLDDRRWATKNREHAEKLGALQLSEMQASASDKANERANRDAYGRALSGAASREEGLTNILGEAQRRGDVATYDRVSTTLATHQAEQHKLRVERAAQKFAMTDDPSDLINTYNNFPDGKKATVSKNADGTYLVQISGPDGKVLGQQNVNRDGIVQAAMMTTDPKTAGAMYLAKLKHDYTIAGHKAKGEQDRETAGVRASGNLAVATAQGDARVKAAGVSASARRYAADQGLAGAQARANATTTAATTRANAAGRAAAGSAKDAKAALDAAFKTDQFSSLDPKTQKHYLTALPIAEKLVAQGVPPYQAAQQAFNEADPDSPRNKFGPQAKGGAAPAAGAPALSAGTSALLGLGDDDDDED